MLEENPNAALSITTIETARLRLVPLALSDEADLHRLMTGEGVRRYLCDGDTLSRTQTDAFAAESVRLYAGHGYGLWAVRPLTPDGTLNFIGFAGYWFFYEPPVLELSYALAESHWGRGLMTEAASALVRYGFEELGLDALRGSTDEPNTASVRVMEKLGMTLEKRTAKQPNDLLHFVLDRKKYQTSNSPYRLLRS